MPAFSTGNTAWDQGLGNLSGALFPDPSKVAQAGYYGAEQRKAQLESARLKEQFAAGHQQLGMVFGQAPGQPTYVTDPATGQQVLADPASGGGSGPSPAAPAPAVPPPAAAPPPSLSGLVTGGGGPAPGPAPAPTPGPAPAPAPAPSFQGGGEGGGAGPGPQAWVPQTTSPAAMSQVIAQAMDKASGSNAGPPLPPASPPAPSAPPAPNTTGTDGSTPAGDGAGPLHPGSLTPAGGGVKMAGPASADGSPAPAAFNLAQYVALGVLHGLPAEQAIAQGRAVVAEWVKNGQMDQVTADNVLSGLDRPEMRVAGINNAGALQRTNVEQAGATTRMGMEQAGATTRTGMEQAGATTRQGMVTGETSREFNEGVVQVVNPANPNGPPLAIKRSDMKPGMQEWNQGVATQANTPTMVNGPNGPINVPASTAMTPGPNQPTAYTPGTADITQQQGGAYETYMDPKAAVPTPITTTAADAAAKGLVKWGTLAPKAPITDAQSFQHNALTHGLDQQFYPQPQKGSLTSPGFVTAPVVLSQRAQAKVQQLEAQFMRDPASRGDPGVAHNMALQALQQDPNGLPSAEQVNALRNAGGIISTAGGKVTDPRLSVSPTYDGKGTTTPHLWVGLRGETNPNDPGAPTAFNPEPGPRTGSKTVPQPTSGPQPGPQVPPGPQPGPQPPTVVAPGPQVSGIFGPQRLPNPAAVPAPVPQPGPQLAPGRTMAGRSAPAPRAAPVAAASPPAPAPNQPIARAAPNQRDGDIAYLNGRPIGIVRGGAVYPMPAQTGPGGGG